jgi:hypothetical protein
MRVYASPRRGHCASCDGRLVDRPVYRMDETYCCLGCAEGGPCICSYEADLAEDGVDGLGLPFGLEPVSEQPAFAPAGRPWDDATDAATASASGSGAAGRP